MKKYFFHNGKAQVGPLTLEELKAYSISRETQVWFEGLAGWQPAGKIEELKSLFTVPPPFHTSSPPIKQHPASDGTSYKTGKFVGRRAWYFLFLLLLIPVAIYFYNRNQEQNLEARKEFDKQMEDDARKNIRDNIMSYVLVGNSNYQSAGFGGISGLSIIVTNNTSYLLDKVKVRVDYLKPDGSKWDDKIVEFNLVSPHTKVTLPVENTERGVSVRYEIVEISSSELGL